MGSRWRYFGHACILIESRETSILFDPVLSYTYESNVSRYTYDDLPDRIDYVVITHNHQDHILFETLLQLRHRIGTVVVPRNANGSLQDPSIKLVLNNVGFKNVVELSELQTIELEEGCDPGRITAIPLGGEHSDLAICRRGQPVVRLNGRMRLLFAADSCSHLEPRLYQHLRAKSPARSTRAVPRDGVRWSAAELALRPFADSKSRKEHG